MRAANLSTKVKRNLRYSTTKRSVTLIVKGARTSNEHTRKDWVSRVVSGLDRRKVTPDLRAGLAVPRPRGLRPRGRVYFGALGKPPARVYRREA